MTGYYCYLLRSVSTPTSKASYVGFSTHPHQRLRQHNGEVKAGAHHTSKYRPWVHVIIVAGFPNKILALQFEWLWQHPEKSRLFRTVKKKGSGTADNNADSISQHHDNDPIPRKVHGYKAKVKILQAILKLPVWQQLHLTVYVPDQSMQSCVRDLLGDNNHLILLHENIPEVENTKKRKLFQVVVQEIRNCAYCAKQLVAEDRYYQCQHCKGNMHIYCLGRKSIEIFSDTPEGLSMVPRLAECGQCHALCQWQQVVQQSRSLSQAPVNNREENENEEAEQDSDDHVSVASDAEECLDIVEIEEEEEDFEIIEVI